MDDSNRVPFKRMRYPVENGELYQQRLQERREQILDHLQCTTDMADEIAELEFAHLMATSKEMVSEDDPGNSKAILARFDCTNEAFIRRSIQFYQNCDMALV